DMDSPKTKRSSEVAVAACPPDDPLVEILSRLHAKPRFRFKCVSKGWRDLITDRLGCRKSPQTLEGFFFLVDEIQSCSDDRSDYGCFIDLLGKPSPLIDFSFTFLTKVPEIDKMVLTGYCNGLLLYGHRRSSDKYDTLGYVVCNPATEEWVAVPSSGWKPPPSPSLEGIEDEQYQVPILQGEHVLTYMLFDPDTSPHFHLVEFWMKSFVELEGVHAYSSEIGVWRPNEGGSWGKSAIIGSSLGSGCVFRGMLHFIVTCTFNVRWQRMIVAVDGEGKTSRTMRWPEDRGHLLFIGQTQGHLHCISGHVDDSDHMNELSIWVLEDYGGEKWVLKHNVSVLQLFGKASCECDSYGVVEIHPKCNMVFFFQYWNQKLISYDMDSKEVRDLYTLVRDDYESIMPYVPYYGSSLALAKKH
uniref:Uncharacterized protein n=2 Tax=Setaria italica TaxID=4555 RepID=K4A3F4_SETIT